MSAGMAAAFGVLETDLGEAVDDCAFEVIVARAQPSAVVKGRVSQPVVSQFAANVSIQPMDPGQKELGMRPEGMLNLGRVKGYSTVELRTSATSECEIPDRFSHLGITYQVERVDNWSQLGNYFYYEAVRINR